MMVNCAYISQNLDNDNESFNVEESPFTCDNNGVGLTAATAVNLNCGVKPTSCKSKAMIGGGVCGSKSVGVVGSGANSFYGNKRKLVLRLQ